MNIRVENGVTIISANVSVDKVKNKTGVKGLSYRRSSDNYSLAIMIKGKKYHIGYYNTIEEGAAMRKIVDEHIKAGTLEEFIKEGKKQ